MCWQAHEVSISIIKMLTYGTDVFNNLKLLICSLRSQLNSLQEASGGARISVNDLVIKVIRLSVTKIFQYLWCADFLCFVDRFQLLVLTRVRFGAWSANTSWMWFLRFLRSFWMTFLFVTFYEELMGLWLKWFDEQLYGGKLQNMWELKMLNVESEFSSIKSHHWPSKLLRAAVLVVWVVILTETIGNL